MNTDYIHQQTAQTNSSNNINPQSSFQPIPEKPKSILPSILIIVTIVILLATTGYFAYQNYLLKNQKTITPPLPTQPIRPTDKPDPTENWKTYANNKYGFNFKYPSDFFYEENYDTRLYGVNLIKEVNVIVSSNQYKTYGQIPLIAVEILKSNKSNINLVDLFKSFKSTNNYEEINFINLNAIKYSITDKNSSSPNNFEKAIFFQKDKYYYHIYVKRNTDEKIVSDNIFDQILSTFKFVDQNTESNIPKSISSLFTKINSNFNLKLIPTSENQYYSPSGTINKKSWKLDLVDSNLGKSITTYLRQILNASDSESAGGAGGGVDVYQNEQFKCFHIYGYRNGDPTNWTDPYNYLTCAEK